MLDLSQASCVSLYSQLLGRLSLKNSEIQTLSGLQLWELSEVLSQKLKHKRKKMFSNVKRGGGGWRREFSPEHWLPHIRTHEKVNHASILMAHVQIFLTLTYELSHATGSQTWLNKTSQN